jgi:hypothetical protein
MRSRTQAKKIHIARSTNTESAVTGEKEFTDTNVNLLYHSDTETKKEKRKTFPYPNPNIFG